MQKKVKIIKDSFPGDHNTGNDGDDRNATQEERRRYAELNIGDEEFVIYDRENHQAWYQSTVAVPVEEIR